MTPDLFDTQASIHPPGTDDERLAWLRLIRSRRVGVTTFFRLIREHGSAQAALEALPEIAARSGARNYEPYPANQAEDEIARARRLGAQMLCYGADDYPKRLAEIPDPPPVVWARGALSLLETPMVALVGARNASSLGTRMARKTAHDLSEAGFTVVSGLARGIDAAAHHATLARGTVAVLAGGADVYYPAENAELATSILKTGVLLSEQPFGLQPMARHFPVRNRIISGLSSAVVIVEAAPKSGSLITAKNALDQGREVFAVPGHPLDQRAAGCNALIRDGAQLIRGADDIIEALEAQPGSAQIGNRRAMPTPRAAEVRATDEAALRRHPPRRPLGEIASLHTQILNRLSPSPVGTDQLIRDLGAPAHAVTPELTTLELEGKIERRAGGLLSLVTR